MNSKEELDSFDVICLWGFSQDETVGLEQKTLVFFTKECTEGLFVYYDGIDCDLQGFQAICKEQVFQTFAYVIHPNLSNKEKKRATKWLCRARMVEWQVQLAASDYQDFGVKVFRNLCEIGKKPFDETSFYSLKDIYKGVPAFICGAGPSLKKQIPFLKRMEKQGLIFAGGAALGILGRLGAFFHIAAGIDPDPDYDKVLMQNGFEAPFFYQTRFAFHLLERVHGPSFQVPSNPGYILEDWFQEGRSFDGGWTVSTFCAALAVYFGCDPIVFVGVDLSYDSQGGKEGTLYFEDSSRGGVKTEKDWVLAAKWLESFIKENKERRFYKSSDEGLFIEGLRKLPEPKTKEGGGGEQIDTQGLAHLLQSYQSPLNTYKEKLENLYVSLERCLGYIDCLLGLFEKNYPRDPRTKGEYVLNLLDLEEQIAYQKILEPIWEVWQFPFGRQLKDPYPREVNRMIFFKRVLQEYKVHIYGIRPNDGKK